VCGNEFDPFERHLYQLQRAYEAVCGEDCWAQHLSISGVRSSSPSYAKRRAPTADYNIARKHLREQERPTLANITAERQRRLDKVRELFGAGHSPVEIAKLLGHKHTAIYADLRALGIDPKHSKRTTDKTAARDRLIEQIKQLIDDGLEFKAIAPIVGTSPAMIGHYARKYLNIDGRQRRAVRRNQTAAGV
jgi:hypothetical protein